MTDNVANDTSTDSSAPASKKRWYVVHAYSGMEKSVQRALQERIEREGLQHLFGQILVPSEEVMESKSGRKTVTERRLFPGYVFVEARCRKRVSTSCWPARLVCRTSSCS